MSEETKVETETAPEPTPAPNPEVLALRFEAAAARASIAEDYVDVVRGLFLSSGQEPSKENMSAFIDELRKTKPLLFGPQPASTAPTATAPTPKPSKSAPPSALDQWQTLRDAGRTSEAEAFYRMHRKKIHRGLQ